MTKEDLLQRYEEWGFPQDERAKVSRSLRINSTKDIKKIEQKLEKRKVKLTKLPFLTSGYDYSAYFPIATALENLLGDIYIQESSAQIPVEVIKQDIKEKKKDKNKIKILDMCAAPGGKTTQLAEVLENKGLIVALDNKKERVKKLIFNLERMKVTNCDVYTIDSRDINDIVEKYGDFDYVLLDAPCSGNYSADKNWLYKRQKGDFKNRQNLQKKLLRAAYDCLKENGVIVYSTCSLEKEENEAVVEFGTSGLGLKVESINIKVGHPGLSVRTKLCKRIWPTQDKMPGFFVAKLRG